jgi:hypothetical protein
MTKLKRKVEEIVRYLTFYFGVQGSKNAFSGSSLNLRLYETSKTTVGLLLVVPSPFTVPPCYYV